MLLRMRFPSEDEIMDRPMNALEQAVSDTLKTMAEAPQTTSVETVNLHFLAAIIREIPAGSRHQTVVANFRRAVERFFSGVDQIFVDI